MLVTKKINRGNIYKKEVEYKTEPRLNATAIKKEAIVSKYSETTQLNLMRKAILGDAEAIAELQVIEDYINGTL